jgi:hypothetical protein
MAKKNIRVVVMAGLKVVGRQYRFLTGSDRWGQAQQVHDPSGHLAGGPAWRRRLPEEQIENNINAWYELRTELKGMVDQLVALDDIARREIGRIRRERDVQAATDRAE